MVISRIGLNPGMVVARPVHVHEQHPFGIPRRPGGIDKNGYLLGIGIDRLDRIFLAGFFKLGHRAFTLSRDQKNLFQGGDTGREILDLFVDVGF